MDWSRRQWLAGAGALAMVGPSGVAAKVETPAGLARRKGIRLGSAVDLSDLDHPDLLDLYKQSITSITPRNALKWTATEQVRGQFGTSDAERIERFARAQNMAFYGHTLVWHRVPEWVSAIAGADDLRAAMVEHVTGIAGRMRGKVWAWDVVNEPLEYDRAEMRAVPFLKRLGPDYIAIALETARRADPDALLVINETHLEKKGALGDARRALFLDMVDRLRRQGAPLDAIGLQGHFRPGSDALDASATAAFCQALKQRGLGVLITELDASCLSLKFAPGFTDEDYGTIFADLIGAAATGDLRGITLWGIAEKYAAPEPRTRPPCDRRVNLYDGEGRPRATLTALTRAISALPDAAT